MFRLFDSEWQGLDRCFTGIGADREVSVDQLAAAH